MLQKKQQEIYCIFLATIIPLKITQLSKTNAECKINSKVTNLLASAHIQSVYNSNKKSLN